MTKSVLFIIVLTFDVRTNRNTDFIDILRMNQLLETL